MALDLAKIELPPSCSEEVLQDAAFLAFDEVLRVGEALQLPLAVADAVCAYVQAATEQPLSCKRFLRFEYSRLLLACGAGNAGFARARMERMAARG